MIEFSWKSQREEDVIVPGRICSSFSIPAIPLSISSLPPKLLALFLLIIAPSSTLSCYVYPTDVTDPCQGKECSFGAQCVPSLDGQTARCQCPEQCRQYGDSVGSRPVCGTDRRDYRNVCELRRAACHAMKDVSVKYQGKCGKLAIHIFYQYRWGNSKWTIIGPSRIKCDEGCYLPHVNACLLTAAPSGGPSDLL